MSHNPNTTMEQEIVTADGDRITVTGDIITEFDGSVFVFPEDTDLVSVLTDDGTFDEYEGATLA